MAKRRTPRRFTPPSPIPSKRELRRQVAENLARFEAKAAERRERGRKAASRPRGAAAFSIAHRLLEEHTLANWSAERETPELYWSERWEFRTRSKRVSYDEIDEWRYRMEANRTIVRYFDNRSVSVMIRTHDPHESDDRFLTASPAAPFSEAMDGMAERVQSWAERYGKVPNEEDFSWIKQITILMRRGRVLRAWKRRAHGLALMRQADEYEAAQKPVRRAKRKPGKKR